MARRTLVLLASLWYLSVVSDGRVQRIAYNEYELLGRCSETCETLPTRSDQFGCDQISDCAFKRRGWTRGFTICDWCNCDCTTSSDIPRKEVIQETTKILHQKDLWNTCKRTCNRGGLQRTDAFGCSEIKDCKHHRNGWVRWLSRCDYCNCTCVIKGYPDTYRLKNVRFNTGSAVTSEADSVVVGRVTVVNYSSREQTFTRHISASVETTRMWEETSSRTLPAGVTVSISAGKLKIPTLTVSLSQRTEEYTWGETKIWTNIDTTIQQVTVGPNCAMAASMVGTHYQASIPYTADLVTIYDNGRESQKSISGVLHEATVYNVHLVYGRCTSTWGCFGSMCMLAPQP